MSASQEWKRWSLRSTALVRNDLIWANISRTEPPRGRKIQMRFQKKKIGVGSGGNVAWLKPLSLWKWNKKRKNPRPAARLLLPCVCVDSRPQGAPALCDDPRELGQPAGVHLQPLQRVVSAGTPGTVIQVVLIQAGLEGATERHSASMARFLRCWYWRLNFTHFLLLLLLFFF